MSRLEELHIQGVRNLAPVQLARFSRVNLVYGTNGSGKTSFLEAIHLLGLGKSFRTAQTDTLIANDQDKATVFARLDGNHKAGLERGRRGKQQLRLDDQSQSNWDEVAKLMPILVLDASAFQLLEGGPRSRRQFMDWGVFHVEPRFLAQWRRTRKCLAHRNLLLKSTQPDRQQLKVWDRELGEAAESVDQSRQAYLAELLPEFQTVYDALAPEAPFPLTLDYDRGWPGDQDLVSVLEQSLVQDLKYKSTQYGPQRADVAIMAGKNKALEVLSRGQQKILVSALKIAQGQLLSRTRGNHSIYLVDDLPAELDADNRQRVLQYLSGLGGQLFVTSVDQDAVLPGLQECSNLTAFHVERGKIAASVD